MGESVRYELVQVEVFDMTGMTSFPGEVSRYYETIRARDIESCVALFAENAVSYDPLGMPPHHGRASVREFLESLFSLTETFALTETSVLAAGNVAAVSWTAQAAGKNGRSISFEGIAVITMDGDGKISSLCAFWDAPPVFAVLTSGAPVIKPPF